MMNKMVAPLSCAVYTIPRADEIGMHTQPANEFFMMTKGNGLHRTFLNTMPFASRDIFFFPRGQLHEHVAESNQCSGWTVRIRDEAFMEKNSSDAGAREVLELLKGRAYAGINHIPTPSAVRKTLCDLFREAVAESHEHAASPYADTMQKGMALHILAMIGRVLMKEEGGVLTSHPGILRVLAWLDEHACQTVCVEEMAEMAGLKRSRFHELFRKTTGLSLVEHLTRLRVGRAVLLLSSSEHSISHICYDVGFASMSRMYDAFARFRGRTPASYQKHHMKSQLHKLRK